MLTLRFAFSPSFDAARARKGRNENATQRYATDEKGGPGRPHAFIGIDGECVPSVDSPCAQYRPPVVRFLSIETLKAR